MNKSYKSVWNESTGSWVAVSELATGRSKSKRAKTAISKAILAQVAVGGMSIAGMSAAMASPDQVVNGQGAAVNVLNGVAIGSDATVDVETDTIHFPGVENGGLAIGNNAYATGSGVAIGQNSQASSESLAFGYNSTATMGSTAIGRNSQAFNKYAVALGENASAAAQGSLALGANSKATGTNSVALGIGSAADRTNTISVGSAGAERQIVNVAAGTADTDVVNVKQLKEAGLNIDTSGNPTNSFVAYDTSAQDVVTLKGTAGTKISNLKAGTTATDAVNLGQLTEAGLNVDTNGKATNAFVAYDSTAKTGVTLGNGTVGAQIHQVVAGTTGTDAVNLAQLTAAGLTVDTAGKATNSFVAYSTTAKDLVTLGGAAGTKISNLAAGTTTTDAVNLGQMNSAIAAISQGGTTLITQPTAGTGDLLVGSAVAGTHVNFANSAGVARELTGVAAGTADTSAVNLSQLRAAGLSVDTNGKATNAFVAYDDLSEKSITLGNSTKASNANAVAIGNGSFVGLGGTNGIAIGNANTVTGLGTVVLGNAVTAMGTNSVVLGSGSDGSQSNVVSVGGTAAGTQRKIVNVAAGTTATDAVNLSQLTAAGLNVDTAGKATNSFVAYSTTAKDLVTLGGAAGTRISNLTAGVLSATSTDAVNGSQLFNLGSSTAAAMGGGAAMGADGKIKAPEYSVGGTTYTDVGNALDAVAALAAGGSADAVIYDSSKHDKVTLGGTGAPVTLANVAAGVANNDAVNVKQLTDAGLIVNSSGVVQNAFVAYDSSAKTGITLGNGTTGAQIHNLVAGTTGTDAVNLQQLKDAGLAVDTSGHVTNSFVAYTDSTKGKVTLGGADGTTLSNVKAGVADMDAVNVKQLTSAGLNIDTNGNVTNSFVAYDDASKSGITLGNGTTGAQIHHVVAGTTGTDAVNLQQLTDAGLAVDTSGHVTNSFVAYDDSSKGVVTFGGGTAGTRLTNVAAGFNDTDAVNKSQLQSVVTGLGGGAEIDSKTGAVSLPTYTVQGITSNNAGDAFKNVDTSLTKLGDAISSLPGGIGLVAQDATTQNITVGALTGGTVVDMTNSSGVARKITGVAAGTVGQSSVDAINGDQLYGVSSSFATAIGGGAAVNSDGTITQPSFTVGGKTVYNVGDAISNLDTNETNNYSNLQTQITNIAAGGTANAVAYDTSAHDKITLGGTAATTTTLLTNLTAGDISSAASTDAVTGGQLYATNQDVAALQTSVQNIASTGTTGIAMNGADGKAGTAGPAGATGADAIAMGDNASASGSGAVVIGGGASGTADGTIAIGGNSSANGKDSIAIGNGATAPANNAVALGANSVADRDNSVSVGSADQQRQITNVAAGTQGTDAVNLNQMNSAVGGIARKAYSGIAAATALTMIPDVDANKTLSLGIGGGTFQGYAATAIGGTARITQNIKVRVGAGWSAAGTTVGAGASYQW